MMRAEWEWDVIGDDPRWAAVDTMQAAPPLVCWATVEREASRWTGHGWAWREVLDALMAWGRVSPERGEIAAAMVVDPSRVELLCGAPAGMGGDVAARCRRWSGVRTHAEIEQAALNERRARVERAQRAAELTPYRRRRTDPLRTDPEARAALGISLGGRRTGRAIRGVQCPECDRPSVFFYPEPGRMNGARCHHQNSCGWWGSLPALAAGGAA